MRKRLIYLMPIALFLALAGYFDVAVRPGYDPYTLLSAMIDKPAAEFGLAALDGADKCL
jgi:hypothetical protein